jgi:signal transduction histidine kinase
LLIILDAAPHGILFMDARSGDIVANPQAMRLLGGPATSGAGPTEYLAQVRRLDDRALPREELPWIRALAGRTITDEELAITRPDGHRIPILLSAAPVLGVDQKALGVVVTFADISAQKDLERLREEFAGVVAHDLRDPIQGILFQINLILGRDDMARAIMSRVQGIEKNARRLGEMTNDLLDATRIDLRRIALDQESIDAASAVRDLVERIRPALSNHPVEVKVSEMVRPAWVDPLRFDQILTNLLDNAAKFSVEGSPITVHVGASDGGIEVAVEDHGVGIPADELPRLFDRFYQGHRARERKTGLGLGLYITKGLVEAHGGRLWVETEPGQGSIFRAWFPPESVVTAREPGAVTGPRGP